MKTIFTAVLLAACASSVYAQTEESKGPVAKLIEDVKAAMPHAHLSDEQKSRWDADKATLESARQARLQGQSADRMKVAAALKDLHSIVDSGAFDPGDQQKIDADIQAIHGA